MLSTSISGFAIFCIIIALFVFRRTIKAITKEAPEGATIAVRQLVDTIRVNALEDRLEQQSTLEQIQTKMKGKTWISAKVLLQQMDNYEADAQNPEPQPTTPQPQQPATSN